MDKTMSKRTRIELLTKLRRRYETAGAEHKRKLLDQAQELLGYHRKSAIRALGAPAVVSGLVILTGRPVRYEPDLLVPWLRPIWQATDYACGRRLVAMLPEWIPAYEQHERRMPVEVREKLLAASGRTLDRLLEPLRGQGTGRSLTRPGTLLRQQIPIRGSLWEEGKAGWLEVEASLPFSLLGLDSDNGGEFLNHHVLQWLQKRPQPVFMTRSRPYKKDDNAHVEQKNWTHIRQCFGYERHDNPEVVAPMNELVKGAYGQLLNYFHASLKLERKERKAGKVRRIYGEAQTPLARVLASAEVTEATKQRLREHKARLNPFALKQVVTRSLKAISKMRREPTH
jgi:hypothetical protein